jgi:hypothetical protein
MTRGVIAIRGIRLLGNGMVSLRAEWPAAGPSD